MNELKNAHVGGVVIGSLGFRYVIHFNSRRNYGQDVCAMLSPLESPAGF